MYFVWSEKLITSQLHFVMNDSAKVQWLSDWFSALAGSYCNCIFTMRPAVHCS